jgi:hypothetical protein
MDSEKNVSRERSGKCQYCGEIAKVFVLDDKGDEHRVCQRCVLWALKCATIRKFE